VARLLAQELGFQFLDTGAMYRAVALAALRAGKADGPPEALAQLVQSLQLWCEGDRVYLNGEDVTGLIRSVEVTRAVSQIADCPAVRQRLVELQRQAAERTCLVTEGRDQGTIVFPHALCKFFLTASAEERARRRYRDLVATGQNVSYEEVLRALQERDRRDRERAIAQMAPAPDAIVIDTTNMSLEEVVEKLARIVRERLPQSNCTKHDAVPGASRSAKA
jgi:cytidylate kinase